MPEIAHFIRPVAGSDRRRWVAVILIDGVEFCSEPADARTAAARDQGVADALEDLQPQVGAWPGDGDRRTRA